MRKLSLLLCFLATAASAQVLTDKTGVMVQPTSYFQGSCSAGRAGRSSTDGAEYLCVNGSWQRKDIPQCPANPLNAACTGTAACLSQTSTNSFMYACVNGKYAELTAGVPGVGIKGLPRLLTVGPETASRSYDFNCAAADTGVSGAYSMDCIQQAIDSSNGTLASPVNILIYPGVYSTPYEITLSNKQHISISGVSRDAVILDSPSGYAVFQVVSGSDDISFSNLSFKGGGGDGYAATNQAIYIGPSVSSTGHFSLTNMTFWGRSGHNSGFLFLFGTPTSPGPQYDVSGNICHTDHYCLDVKGGAANSQYISVNSTGNQWIGESTFIMPVDILGGSAHFFSTGDLFSGDCMALGITNYEGEVYGRRKIVQISGATFYVGDPTRGATRADCSTYPGGPSAIVLGQNNGTTNYTNDNAADVIQITSPAIYVQSQGALSHSIVRNRAKNLIVQLSSPLVNVDTTTNFIPYWQSQGAPVRVYGGAGASSSANNEQTWEGFSNGSTNNKFMHIHEGYISTDKYLQLYPGISGVGKYMTISFDGARTATKNLRFADAVGPGGSGAGTLYIEGSEQDMRIGNGRGGNGGWLQILVDADFNFTVAPIDPGSGFNPGYPKLGQASSPWKYLYMGCDSYADTDCDKIVFDGTTFGTNTTTLDAVDPTAANVVRVPNASGYMTLAPSNSTDKTHIGVMVYSDNATNYTTGTLVCGKIGLTCLNSRVATTGASVACGSAPGAAFYAACTQ